MKENKAQIGDIEKLELALENVKKMYPLALEVYNLIDSVKCKKITKRLATLPFYDVVDLMATLECELKSMKDK